MTTKPFRVSTLQQDVDALGEWAGGELSYDVEGRYETLDEATGAARELAASSERIVERFDVPRGRAIGVDQFVRVERCDEGNDGDVIDDLICTGGDLAHEPRVALHNDPSRPTYVHEMTDEEVALCHRNVDLMDDDIRNALDGAGDDDRAWLALYAARHEAAHGTPWCLP